MGHPGPTRGILRILLLSKFGQLLASVVRRSELLTRAVVRAALDPLILPRVLSDRRFLSRLFETKEVIPFLRRLLQDKHFQSSLLEDPESWRVFGELLASDNIVDKKLERGLAPFLQKVIEDERFGVYVNKSKDLWAMHLRRLLSGPECTQWLKAEPGIWETYKRPLQDPGVYAQLLDAAFFQRLFSLEYLPRLITSHDDMMQSFSGFSAHNAVLRKLARNVEWLAAAAAEPGIADGLFGEPAILSRPVVALQAELSAEWQMLLPALDATIPHVEEKRLAAHRALKSRHQIRDAILDIFCEEDRIRLAHGIMRFPDRQSLWVLLHELLVDESYYFESPVEAPFIIDAGAHFGLATYYFKSLYPKARVLAFEPVPELQQMIRENAEANGFADVTVEPCALSDSTEAATFLISEKDSMAGSLTDRRRVAGDVIRELRVPCRRLSEFLNEEVHFLKLDIEGSEDKVLQEAGSKLENVHNIFVEYHDGYNLPPGRLLKILNQLHHCGFELQIAPSISFQKQMSHRPIEWLGKPYSALIWGSNPRFRA
jgi:FkbM family methyltransferase